MLPFVIAAVAAARAALLAPNAQCSVMMQSAKQPSIFICTAAHYAQPPKLYAFSGSLTYAGSACELKIAASDDRTILLADRGSCSFSQKAFEAQNRGFKALLIIDKSDEQVPPPPAFGDDTPLIEIPVVSVILASAIHARLIVDILLRECYRIRSW